MRTRREEHRSERARGSALIVVLWVIGLMSMMVMSLAFEAHIEARILSFYRKRFKAEYLAKSGLEIAQMLMTKSVGIGPDTEPEKDDRWFDPARSLKNMRAVTLSEPLGEGTITVRILPEEARRNVNLLTPEDWERILEATGVPDDMWPGLIDSVSDWIDKDEVLRRDGAESEDYYALLEPPYRAKNGPLDTVGELLLVKGFSRAILSGGMLRAGDDEEEPVYVTGIEPLLTTYGDGRVNINAATPEVLMTLPNMDDQIVDTIVEERSGWVRESGKKEDSSFKSVDDCFARVPLLDARARSLVTTDASVFRVISVGTVQGVSRQIWCIAQVSGAALKILRWREED